MKIGYFAVGIGATVEPEILRAVAMAAERLGFATIWAPEHVVLLEEYASKYPYSSGQFPGPANLPIADPFTTLAYVAASTSTIRLGTGICLVPEHNPSSSPRPRRRSTGSPAVGSSSAPGLAGSPRSSRRSGFRSSGAARGPASTST